MMQEKNNKEIAAVIYGWLDKALPSMRWLNLSRLAQ